MNFILYVYDRFEVSILISSRDTELQSWYIVKGGLYLAAKNAVSMELKFQFVLYVKCVMHCIWIPYSSGFMLKNISNIHFCMFLSNQ